MKEFRSDLEWEGCSVWVKDWVEILECMQGVGLLVWISGLIILGNYQINVVVYCYFRFENKNDWWYIKIILFYKIFGW